MARLYALYGFKRKVRIDPLAPREWFETHADAVIYSQRGQLPLWGHWRGRGYAAEWDLEIVVDPADPFWARSAREDVVELRTPGGRLGTDRAPFALPRAASLIPVYALYGFFSPPLVDVARVGPRWLDAHADAVIFALERVALPFGHFLAATYAREVVAVQFMADDDERVKTARRARAAAPHWLFAPS